MKKTPLSSRVLKTEAVDWRSFQFLQQETFKNLGPDEKAKLKASIINNNFTQPFYVWQDAADGVIYCLDGWHRSLVMKEMEKAGYKIPYNLPATFIECRDKQEAAKLVILYSSMYAQVTEMGFTQFIETYKLDLEEISAEMNLPDFSFDMSISDKMLELEEDGFNEVEELSKIISATSKIGDAFKLGNHLLICADSRDLNCYCDLLSACDPVTVLYCDPPYNISYDYESGLNSRTKKYTNKTFSDSLTDGVYADLISATLFAGKSWAGNDLHVFYWCDESYISLIQETFKCAGVTNRRVCFWIKDRLNPVPQIAFNKVIEPCVYGTIGSPYLNPEFQNFTEVLNSTGSHSLDELMTIMQLWMIPRDSINSYQHPTTKPIKLHEKPLKRCSRQGDTVMDLFGGSGSTLISCEQLNRKAILVEQDPVFCDLIIKRYLAYCEKKGVNVTFTHCNGTLTLNDFANEPALNVNGKN